MSAIAACLAESGPSAVLPFTTSMTADHAPRAFSAEMNECLKLGSGGGGANVRVWVWPEAVGQGVIAQLLPFVHSRSAPRSRG